MPADKVAGLAGDLAGQVLVQQKMLAEFLACIETEAADRVA
jgi:hypothetical protein